MQNEITLISLGFTKSGECWYIVGAHQAFRAEVVKTRPEYVSLYMIREIIDERPLSHNRGSPYISYVKDCCSDGSVLNALKSYDLPTERLTFVVGGILVN